MNSLTLTLKPDIDGPLDLFGLVPDRLCGLDIDSIAALTVVHAGRECRVAELFDITDGDRSRMLLQGNLRRADRVGGGMIDGWLQVESSVAHRLADQMVGGVLKVAGSVGDFACSKLRGGLVEIDGDAGDYCAGAGKNFRRGMRGGLCRVLGNVGKYAGYRLRRGSFIVCGDADMGLASSMIAGTILVLGNVQAPWAVGVRRGTLITVGSQPPQLHVGFTAGKPYSYRSCRCSWPNCNAICQAHRKRAWLRGWGSAHRVVEYR